MPSFPEKLDDFLVRNFTYFNYKSYVKRLCLKGNEKVLEIGCGGGNLSRFLAERLPLGELVCIDNSEYWIEKAKDRLKKFQNIKFESADFLDFSKESYFDIAVIHYVLHDIPKEKRRDVINILDRRLKEEKGKIYIREPTRESHGMQSYEIRSLMMEGGFSEQASNEGFSFPLRSKVYAGVFQKIKN